MKNSKRRRLFEARSLLTTLFLCMSIVVFAQTKTVTGTVVDERGEAIIGASVSVKGTSTGTMTDLDGKFSISVKNNDVLTVSYVGYTEQKVSVAGKTDVKIVMKEDSQVLDEFVVVGYGVQKKSDVTGAIASVSAEDLTIRPVNNALEALQGKAPGVDITTNERPGELGKIYIRGTRSLLANANDPLYVVDGVPLMSASGIETLNPRDIETIDILKDASATAIYGSRGANGVVIVTTKQGKEGRFRIDYSGTVTFSDIVEKSPSMNASDYITYRRWAAYNADASKYASPYSPSIENDKLLFANDLYAQANVLKGWASGTWDGSKVTNTDWTDMVTQTGISHEHTLSASGGSEKMNAYVSFGYLKNEGTQIGQWYERYTGKISANLKPVNWFSMNASINASWNEQDYGMSTLKGQSSTVPDAIYGAAKALHNYAVPYDDNGNIILQPGGYISNTIVGESEKSTQQRQTFRAMGNFSATLDFGEMGEALSFAKGLRYKISFGPDFRHWREGAYIDATSANRGTGAASWARLKNRRDLSWTLDNMVMFDRTFAKKHKIGVTLLQTASKWNVEESAMEAENIPRPDYLWNAFSNTNNAPTTAANKVYISSDLTNRQLTSYMVRLNYGFNERYLLTMTGRWDGASQLAEGHKWDFFPSTSLAWRIKEEAFLQDVSWLDNLKIRLGVGVTGNAAAIAPYSTKGSINTLMLPFNGMDDYQAYATNEPYYFKDGISMANPNLGWEKTTQYNFGIDFGFLRNRISGSLDVYTSRTNDLLMDMNIPTLTGFGSTIANVGKSKNKGVEVLLNFIPVQTGYGLTWESSFNAAYQKDEITELAYGKNDMPDNSWFIGKSLNVFYAVDNAGLWQDTPEDLAEMAEFNKNGHNFTPGSVRPVDQNGDYKIDGDDRVILGNKNPDWTMGWTNTLSWKGFEASISLFSRMGYMVDGLGNGLSGDINITQKYNDYWTPENTGARYQKPVYLNADGNAGLLGYRNASFIKIRNISLGYNFSRPVCSLLGIDNLKLYGQVINPGSLYQSVNSYDLDTGNTYYNRSFVIGLQVGF